MAQRIKSLSAVWETQVQSLGQEDPLEKEMATHSSILAWRIPRDRGAWWATVHRVTKSWTQLHFTFLSKVLQGKTQYLPSRCWNQMLRAGEATSIALGFQPRA